MSARPGAVRAARCRRDGGRGAVVRRAARPGPGVRVRARRWRGCCRSWSTPGAAAGSLVWLGGTAAGPARRFARALALTLLGLSVAANALGHGLAAFALAPAWWVVVIVSAVAPAVLGAVVHLAVLVGRPHPAPEPRRIRHSGRARRRSSRPRRATRAGERARELIAAGAGRRRLAQELDITEYEARQLLDQRPPRHPTPTDTTAGSRTGDDRSDDALDLFWSPVMMFSTILILVALVAAAPIAWRLGRRGLGFLLGAIAVLPAITLARQVPVWVLVALAALAVVFGVHHMSRTSATVTRWGSRIRRKVGVASTLDIIRVGSALAMRRKAATVRPSLRAGDRRRAGRPAGRGRAARLRGGGAAVPGRVPAGVVLGRGRRARLRRPADRQDPVAGRADHRRPRRRPGHLHPHRPATTRPAACAPGAGPVFVFNAVGLAGLDSTITFDPLTGCADPVTASERATDMLGAVSRGNSGDREFWEGQARRVLAALLHAAALDEGRSTMADVLSLGVEPRRRGASGDRAAAQEQRAGLPRRRRPVPHHQPQDPHLDHLHDHARARLAHQPRRGRGRRAVARRRSTSPTCSCGGRRCTCWVGRRPRPRRWCAR